MQQYHVVQIIFLAGESGFGEICPRDKPRLRLLSVLDGRDKVVAYLQECWDVWQNDNTDRFSDAGVDLRIWSSGVSSIIATRWRARKRLNGPAPHREHRRCGGQIYRPSRRIEPRHLCPMPPEDGGWGGEKRRRGVDVARELSCPAYGLSDKSLDLKCKLLSTKENLAVISSV